jgi:hypothetical protein
MRKNFPPDVAKRLKEYERRERKSKFSSTPIYITALAFMVAFFKKAFN